MAEQALVNGKIITKGLFTEKIVRMKVKNLSPVEVPYVPGQYISIKISEEQFIPYYVFRYYPEINAFELAIDISKEEPGINYIKSRGVGDDVQYYAPQGKLTLDYDVEENYLIAEGTYVSPFLAFLYHMEKSPKQTDLSLFWGVKEEKDLFLVNTIYAFSSSMSNFSYDIFISEGTSTVKHRPGRVVDAISKVQFEKDAKIYICGEHTMVSEVTAVLKNKGVPIQNIISEKVS